MTSPLSCLSPLDGRYSEKCDALRKYFSEEALIHYRVFVEIEWLLFLTKRKDVPECRPLTKSEEKSVKKIHDEFSEKDALRVKEIEKKTNHDVKAVEYFLKERFSGTSLEDISEWLHFSLTSEDVNNLSYSLMLKDSCEECLLGEIEKIEKILFERSREWKGVPMLARTHGQPASPTTMGKAWLNFASRIRRQREGMDGLEFLGKLNGATGNFNAHIAAYPRVHWLEVSRLFVEKLGLVWQPVTDQIEPHDFIAELCHSFSRVGTILIDFSRDVWGYVSLGYFRQKVKKGEVGSSTMPHKVNPIDFENAEGNLGIANTLFHFFSEKLPVSRWQRDLTDSTVLRNLGVAFGHFLLALRSLEKGIEKLELNPAKLETDLLENYEVLSEAVQTVLRKNGVENAYEKLKELTRGKRLTKEGYESFVSSLGIPAPEKKRLLSLTPEKYTGLAEKIVDEFSR